MAASGNEAAVKLFTENLASQVNLGDIEAIQRSQLNILSRLEKTNAMLVTCNTLSTARHEVTARELKRHSQLLTELKRDLDNTFKRIRLLKARLSLRYPEEFQVVSASIKTSIEDDDDD